MTTHFKIVVPSYNSFPWIERTLLSIETQAYRYFDVDVVVVDDASTEDQHRQAITNFCKRNDWIHVTRETNGGPLRS